MSAERPRSKPADLADTAIRRRLARPDLRLLEAIRRQQWTSHNIPLTGEETTLNQEGLEAIGDESRTRILRETLRMMLNGSLSGRRLLDLGSLEGGLALEMARDGMEVLGVEGRRSNFEKCQLIADYFSLPNLRFLHLDVRELTPEKHGTFDAVLCCGLLYHLADPFSFLDSLARLTETGGVV
ncbi:MAG: class I SAM-dependent methyltransferase, partial [Thermoanaerobaculia bacterium]